MWWDPVYDVDGGMYIVKKYTNGRTDSEVTPTAEVVFENYNTPSYIGSMLGSVNFMEGFMYSFTYSVYKIDNFEDRFAEHGLRCPVGPPFGCLSLCSVGEFISADNTCCECHPTCAIGCLD